MQQSVVIDQKVEQEQNPGSVEKHLRTAGIAPASFFMSETAEPKPAVELAKKTAFASEKEPAKEPAKKTRKPRAAKGATAARRHLTTSQKAEAVALWRTGSVTLDDLSARFGKRAETFSKLFKRMGIKKGSAAAEHTSRVAAAVETKILSDVEEHARRVAQAKEEHYKMSNGIAKLVWSEIVRARQADLKIEGLKETMQTLRLASEVIGNTRKELWRILGIEEADKKKELEDLPDLSVRELLPDEIAQLQSQQDIDELGGDDDPGADMIPGEESL